MPRLVILGAAAQAVKAVMRWAEQHPVWTALILVGVLTFIISWTVLGVRADREAQLRLAELERSISSTDALSGPEFEQWVARLLSRTGFTEIENCGGTGDLGADLVATSPLGARVVFQCKRYARNVSSPDIQRFAGTCHTIHAAEIAAVVTTAGYSRPARELARRLKIVLVDRDDLAAWAADYLPPAALAGSQIR